MKVTVRGCLGKVAIFRYGTLDLIATAERLQLRNVELFESGEITGYVTGGWGLEGKGLTRFRRWLGVGRVWKPLGGYEVWHTVSGRWVADTGFVCAVTQARRLQFVEGKFKAAGIAL